MITLHGRIPSKKNSRRFIMAGKRAFTIANKDYEAWHQLAMFELQHQIKGMKNRIRMSGPYAIKMRFWGISAAAWDLTNKAESIMDLLVDYGLLEDDNWKCVPSIALDFIEIDRQNPRVEIDILKPKVGNQTTNPMKTINDIVAELQQVEKTELDAVVAALETAVTDLQALAGATPATPAAPTVQSVQVTFTDGTTQNVPTAA